MEEIKSLTVPVSDDSKKHQQKVSDQIKETNSFTLGENSNPSKDESYKFLNELKTSTPQELSDQSKPPSSSQNCLSPTHQFDNNTSQDNQSKTLSKIEEEASHVSEEMSMTFNSTKGNLSRQYKEMVTKSGKIRRGKMSRKNSASDHSQRSVGSHNTNNSNKKKDKLQQNH